MKFTLKANGKRYIAVPSAPSPAGGPSCAAAGGTYCVAMRKGAGIPLCGGIVGHVGDGLHFGYRCLIAPHVVFLEMQDARAP
jgi:hypothetical protein